MISGHNRKIAYGESLYIYDPTTTNAPTPDPTQPPTLDGCDFDIDAYLERCYCVDNNEPSLSAGLDRIAPMEKYVSMPVSRGYQSGYDHDAEINKLIHRNYILLCINSFAILIIILMVRVGFCVYIKELDLMKCMILILIQNNLV